MVIVSILTPIKLLSKVNEPAVNCGRTEDVASIRASRNHGVLSNNNSTTDRLASNVVSNTSNRRNSDGVSATVIRRCSNVVTSKDRHSTSEQGDNLIRSRQRRIGSNSSVKKIGQSSQRVSVNDP